MDLELKQWRSQQQNESEEQSSATKISNFFFDQIQSQTDNTSLPLFVPETNSSSSFSSFSHDTSSYSSSSSTSSRFLKMGNFFSWSQWQELELQALIYRYMLAGASVPQELLLPIKKSLFSQSPLHFLHHDFPSHHQPSWYWGRGAMDAEPGRCKRTDGKKWRCSRDVVAGHKYCDRHIHRGRNRSRKPVETTTTTTTSSFVLNKEEIGHDGPNNNLGASHSPSQHLHLSNHQSYSSETKQESSNNNNNKRPYEAKNGFNNVRSEDGHILRHFFDDWPARSLSDLSTTSSPMNSTTTCHLSDVSLKLSTGNEEEEERNNNDENMNWWSCNGENQQQNNNNNNNNNMGGPLAEALRSASHHIGISTTHVFH
ncbi:unnamed protein product [Cochlearia groenlandica]